MQIRINNATRRRLFILHSNLDVVFLVQECACIDTGEVFLIFAEIVGPSKWEIRCLNSSVIFMGRLFRVFVRISSRVYDCSAL
jgi:hypothetical protein